MLCLKHALSIFLCTFEMEKKALGTDWQTYVCMFLAGNGMSWCLSDVADGTAILLMEGWGKALAFSRNGATEGLPACETASQPPWLRQSGLSLTVSCSQPSLPQNPIASSLENSPGSTLSSPFLLLFWSRVLFTSWPNNCNGLCSGLHFTSFSLFQFVLNTYFQAKAPKTWLHTPAPRPTMAFCPAQLNLQSSTSLSKSLLVKRSHFCWRSRSKTLGAILGFAKFWLWAFGKVASALWNINFDIYKTKDVDRAGGPGDMAESGKSLLRLCVKWGLYKYIFWNLGKKRSRYSYHS